MGVAWRILERNDGFVVQITFVGSFKTELEVTGYVKGQQQGLQKLQNPPGIWMTLKEYVLTQSLSQAEYLVGFCGLFSFVVALIMYRFAVSAGMREKLGPEKLDKQTRLFLKLQMAVAGLSLLTVLWLWQWR